MTCHKRSNVSNQSHMKDFYQMTVKGKVQPTVHICISYFQFHLPDWQPLKWLSESVKWREFQIAHVFIHFPSTDITFKWQQKVDGVHERKHIHKKSIQCMFLLFSALSFTTNRKMLLDKDVTCNFFQTNGDLFWWNYWT